MCTRVYAVTASLLLPHQEIWEIVSRNVAAAICEAEAPCSVSTALYPLSSLTSSLPEHNPSLPCTLRCFKSAACSRWTQNPLELQNERIFCHFSLVETIPPLALLS